MGTLVIGLYAATNPARVQPYLSRQWCVDKYDEAARQVHHKPAAQLKWDTKMELLGVMETIKPSKVKEKLDQIMKGKAL